MSAVLAGCAGAPEERSEPAPGPSSLEQSAQVQRILADALAHRPPPEKARVPAGFRLRRIAEAGLSFALPPHWQLIRGHDAHQPGLSRLLGGLHRDLGSLAGALAIPDSPLKAFAFDARFHGGYATTATLIQSPAAAGETFERWSKALLADIRALPSIRGRIAVDAVRLPAGDALRLNYRKVNGGEKGTLVAITQWLLLTGDKETIVTFTTLPKLKASYLRAFEQSAGALQAG